MESVAVTGAAGLIGQRVLLHLERDPGVRRIVALDLRPPERVGEKVVFVRHDVRDPVDAVLREHGVDTVVHLAFVVDPMHDRKRERAINVGGTERVLEACDAVNAGTVLLASSGTVYGAWPDNPPLLTEDAPLRGKPGYPYVEDKLELERMASEYAAAHGGCRVLVIRPTVVVGPHMDNFLSRFLLRPVAFRVAGANPPVPVVHEDDVGEAIWRLLAEDAPGGAYNLNSGVGVPFREALSRLGRRGIPLPAPVLKTLAGLAWILRLRALSEVPPAMLDFIRWRWSGDGTKIERETSFRYAFSADEAMESFIRSHTGR